MLQWNCEQKGVGMPKSQKVITRHQAMLRIGNNQEAYIQYTMPKVFQLLSRSGNKRCLHLPICPCCQFCPLIPLECCCIHFCRHLAVTVSTHIHYDCICNGEIAFPLSRRPRNNLALQQTQQENDKSRDFGEISSFVSSLHRWYICSLLLCHQ